MSIISLKIVHKWKKREKMKKRATGKILIGESNLDQVIKYIGILTLLFLKYFVGLSFFKIRSW